MSMTRTRADPGSVSSRTAPGQPGVDDGATELAPGSSALTVAHDIASIGRIDAVPSLLRVLCETTGMGFAAVARVTADRWIACAVRDEIEFGLRPGGELDIDTTLCKEVRQARGPIVIEHASRDPVYCSHHTPRLYRIESYISVPIVLSNGEYFGTLCAIDPRPAMLPERIVATFTLFAQLIGLQLENERKRDQAHKALLDERETGELREQFIAVLGHDLRNPLQAVAACGQLLAMKADQPETVRGLAGKINTNVKRMSALIDDVLDFARARLGDGLSLRPAVVADLDPALRAVIAELRDAHPDRAIEERIEIGRPVVCDRGRLQQLASNLLANAIVHGAPDRPVAFVAAVVGDALVIEVRNDGEPIPPSSLAKIFQPFWRHSTSVRREGLGLGLHICDQIVRAHDGRLEVSSTREGGTRFTASVPAAGAAPAPKTER